MLKSRKYPLKTSESAIQKTGAQSGKKFSFFPVMYNPKTQTTIYCGMKFLTPICRFVKKCGVCVIFSKKFFPQKTRQGWFYRSIFEKIFQIFLYQNSDMKYQDSGIEKTMVCVS